MGNTIPDISLNDGTTIPQLGFGVFQIEPKDTAKAVTTAFEAGYRHIDTAEMYGNEAEVGEAVRVSGLDRGSVYVTSKLSNAFHRPDDARRAFDSTLSALKMDYIDLFLIHWPLPTCTTVTSSPPGRCSRSSSGTAGPVRSACRTSRWRTWSGWPPRRTWCRR
ncbi:hypothetical protein GCM10027614_62290 [Micromonospora vulcania]